MQSLRSRGRIAALLSICALGLAGACSSDVRADDAIPWLVPQTIPVPVHVLPNPAFAVAGGRDGSASVADIAERVVPSVVNIASQKAVRRQRNSMLDDPFFPGQGRGQPRQDNSLGSGVIVSADGLILTSNHVVDGADEIRVTLSDNREYDAKVVGSDPQSDLAVLRLQGANLKNLTPIALGDSSRLRLGDVVIAIGNPFGVGQTVTMGIVSAKGRAMGLVDYEDFIQTDAAINPGNSGGALVSMNGELVGINTAILSRSGGSQGIGFAIPTEMAEPIMRSLLKNGKVLRGFLGVGIQTVDQDLADGLGLASTEGVLISDVGPDSPAATAGLQRGDVVVRLDGKAVTSAARLRSLVAGAGAGGKVTMDVLRDGAKRTFSVQLGELPVDQGVVALSESEGEAGALSGLSVGPLDDAARQEHQVPRQVRQGVVVTAVLPGSAAAHAGLQKGDVVLELNRQPVDSVKTFSQGYDQAKRRVLLLIVREGRTMYLAVQK